VVVILKTEPDAIFFHDSGILFAQQNVSTESIEWLKQMPIF